MELDASPPVQPVKPEVEAPAEAMGRTVGRGASWVVAASLGSKVLAFASQIVLGIYLTPDAFAVFGVALAISGLTAVFKDGGVREVLVQRGRSQYHEFVGPVFWLATWMNVLAAVLVWSVAGGVALLQNYYPQLLSDSYRDPWLPWMLAVIGSSVPMQSPAAILQARLRLDLRFAELSRIAMWSALLRNVSVVAAAWLLRNPIAFVVPTVLVAIYEGVAAYRITGESPWRLPAKVRMWKELLSVGGWMILQSAAGILFDLASFAVIGLILPQDVVGLYVFAYNWITQTQTLMGNALMQVLFPALSRLIDDIDRFRAAVRRAQHVQMLLGSVASLGLAVIMKPLEAMIWNGKWAACVPMVMILGVFFPFRVTFGLSTAVMLARGRFKPLSMITTGEGVLIVAASCAGALITHTAEGVAYGAGLSLLVGRITGTWLVFREINVSFLDILKGMFPSWVVSLVAAWFALAVTDYFHVAEYLARVVGSTGLSGRLANLLMIFAIGGLFTVIMAVLSRILLRASVQDVLAVLPIRISRLGRRIMVMPANVE